MGKWAVLLVAGSAVLLAAACGGDGDEGPTVREVTAPPASPSPSPSPSPTPVPPSPTPSAPTPLPTASMPPPGADLLEAILVYIQGRGWRYGGDCLSTSVPEDVGAYCVGAIRRRTDGSFEVPLGPVAAEGVVTVAFRQAGGSWTVAAEEPIPAPGTPVTPTAGPPPSDDLIAAVQGYVQARGWVYGGDCRATDLPADAGKHCFGGVFVRPDGAVSVGIGRTFSEGGVMVRFGLTGTAWVVTGEETIAPPGP